MSVKSARLFISLPYLFLASVAALFLEMTLIRWISTEVRLFAYVQNLALIACFLGFGLGCYHAGKKIQYWVGLGSTLLLAVLVILPFPLWRHFLIIISELLTLSPDAAMWSFHIPTGQSITWGIVIAVAVVCVFLMLLIGAMFPLGQYIGKALDDAEKPLTAYSVNLAGSLIGTWLLAALSFQWTEPHLWLLVSFVLIILLLPQAKRLAIPVLVLLALVIPLRWHRSVKNGVVWSPYQKLSIVKEGPWHYQLSVNNTGYMKLSGAIPGVDYSESSYDAPFRFVPGRQRVLIVGSGGGNDIAAALRNGVQHVDAVEIDPAIVEFGRTFHPDHPYDSKNVTVHVEDARKFMRTTTEQYDAILFGLLDSHTVLSGQTNMRLDNYVYTQESFRDAMRLLKPDGVLVLKFEVREPWLWMGNRFDGMLTSVAGRPPVIFYCDEVENFLRASVFLTSKSDKLWERAQSPEMAAFLEKHPPKFQRASASVVSTSDDWPYIYHRAKNIPRTHLTIMVLLIAMAAVLFGRTLKVKQASTWHFLLLGAGFLCLETQLISRSALYFGNTWLVNCFGISMVLIVLLVANVFVEKKGEVRLPIFFGILIGSLLLNYVFPWSAVPLGVTQTGLLLYVMYSIPMFCAGVIFAQSFRNCAQKSLALGANLFGATVGGMSQNLSFIFGLKALLIVSAVFYAGAWLFFKGAATEMVPETAPDMALAATAE